MKSLPSGVLSLLESGRFAVRTMLRVDLVSGPAGVWSDAHDIVFEAVTYKGLAGNMTVDPIASTSDLNSDQVRVTLSGLDPDALAIVDDSDWYQRPAVVYDAYLDAAGAVIHVEPAFVGFLDTAARSDRAGQPATIELAIESTSRELSRSNGRTYSNSDQRAVGGATDGFLKHLAQSNSDTNIYWGREAPRGSGGSLG